MISEKMKSPLVIIIELLTGLITNTVNTIGFVVEKLLELFGSLLFISTFGVPGVIIAVAIGAVVFIFASTVIFKTGSSLVSFGIAIVVVFVVLFLLQSI